MTLTVCEISTKKDVCTDYHKAFELISKTTKTEIEPRLKELFELDAKDFEKVVKLRVARDKALDQNEKSKNSREALDLLQIATDYTFEVAQISLRLMDYGVIIFENGWHAIRGDSGVAISAAMSSVMSCIFIINLNLKTLNRRKYAADNIQKVQELQRRLEELQTRAFTCVTSISSESVESIQLDLENI